MQLRYLGKRGVTDKLPRLRIVNTTGVGFKTKVYVDDVDISECFSSAVIRMGLKDSVQVLFEAVASQVDIDGMQHIEMPEHTRELLTKFGWTPPADGDTHGELRFDDGQQTIHTVEQAR